MEFGLDILLNNPRLAITTTGYAVSLAAVVAITLFVLLRSERKTMHVMFVLGNAAIAVYAVMFIAGTLITNADMSRRIWFLSLVDVFIVTFNLHWTLALTGRLQKRRRELSLFYTFGAFIIAAAAMFPRDFIMDAVPKWYFNNYPVPGPIYTALFFYFIIAAAFTISELLQTYRSANEEMRNRLKYILIGTTIGYGAGSTSFLLSFDLPFDPAYSMFFGAYSFLFLYAILKRRVMNIRIALTRAGGFAVATASFAALIFFANTLNAVLAEAIPGFPRLAVPIAAGFSVIGLGYLVWRRLTETDRVKQEFLTVAAHKLRTPLTRLRLAAETLLERSASEGTAAAFTSSDRRLLRHVANDVHHMIDLVNILLDAAERKKGVMPIEQKITDLNGLIISAQSFLQASMDEKNIQMERFTSPSQHRTRVDENRIRAVLRILLENALAYTPSGGTVRISLEQAEDEFVVSVRDTGMGISPTDLPHVFSKFFRSENAIRRNTDGLGMSLFFAKQIIEQHGGRMWAESAGNDRGSIFSFSLPAEKSPRP